MKLDTEEGRKKATEIKRKQRQKLKESGGAYYQFRITGEQAKLISFFAAHTGKDEKATVRIAFDKAIQTMAMAALEAMYAAHNDLEQGVLVEYQSALVKYIEHIASYQPPTLKEWLEVQRYEKSRYQNLNLLAAAGAGSRFSIMSSSLSDLCWDFSSCCFKYSNSCSR